MNPLQGRALVRAVAAATGCLLTSGLLMGVVPGTAAAAQDLVVAPSPDQTMPRITNGRVYGIDTHGSLAVVGGSFDTIREGSGGGERTRQWVFMFNTDTGRIVDTFAPVVRGPAPNTSGVVGERPGVQAVRFAPDGQSVYLAGDFTTVNGASSQRIARLDLTGKAVPGFKASANGTVNDIALTGDRLVVAGRFTVLNDQPVARLGSVSAATGVTQTDFNIQATVSRYEFAEYVQEIDASPDGRWLAVAGNFEKLGGRTRKQIGLIDLTGRPRVSDWATTGYAGDCASVYNDSWIRGIDISPDSTFMVVSTTGAFRGYDSLCDSAARLELPSSPTYAGPVDVQPTWRNLTGGDTLWATEITESAVYIGGHQRWMNNPNPSPGGDNDGPGSVERYGFVALDPHSGVPLSLNPGRDRGRGAEALHASGPKLYIGSDTDLFNGEIRQRLAVLSTNGGVRNPAPTRVELPVDLYFRVGNDIRRATFDGADFGSSSNASGSSVDGLNWGDLRDGFVQDGRLHYFGGQSAFYSRPFDGTSFGTPRNLSNSVGYVDANANITPFDQPVGVAETQVATYLNGRIYFRKSGDSKLYSRGYSLESGIIGSHQRLENSRNWSNARSLEFIGDWLYAAWSNGALYRFHAPNGRIDFDSNQLVDFNRGIDWSQATSMFAVPRSGTAKPPTAPDLTCSGSTPWRVEYFNNTTLAGAPNVTRCESGPVQNWGSGSPSGTDLGSNNFTVRYTRTLNTPQPASIRLQAFADDAVRGYVNGELVIDGWGAFNSAGYDATSTELPAGDHVVTFEYRENSNNASINASASIVAPVADPGTDNIPGETTITAPTANQVIVPAGTVGVTGSATDDRSVADVRFSIRERDGAQRWLQPDGTFAAGFAALPVSLQNAGGANSGWSAQVTLPEGSFAAIARTVDAAGNVDLTEAYTPFTVSSTTADTSAPSAAVTSPANGATVRSSTVTGSGTATDNVGVTFVRVGVYNRDDATNRWLQANGTFGPNFYAREATLASPGGKNTTWTVPGVTLPSGRYAFDVRARDAAGNETKPSVFHPFVVDTSVADSVAPTVTVTDPARNTEVRTRPVQVTGSAADNQGVDSVRVAVYNREDATNRWLQPNGTWGPAYNFVEATLASQGATSTSWSLPVTLPTGSYAVDVRSRDASGNLSGSVYRPFTVAVADAAAPQTQMSTAPDRTVSASRIVLQGTARDDQAVRTVEIRVQRTTTKKVKRSGASGKKVRTVKRTRYLTASGGWGKKRGFVGTSIADDLASATQWRTTLKLTKPGRYRVWVRAVDANGNGDGSPARASFRVK